MELTPHIKVLFDDLNQLVKGIVVKRPDIAMEREAELDTLSLEMYYAYRDIINGVDSVSSYNSIPAEVLKTLVGWTPVEDGSVFVKVKPGTGSIPNPNTASDQHYAYRAPTPADQLEPGTLWVHKIGKEYYTEIHSEIGKGIFGSILVEIDDSTSYGLGKFINSQSRQVRPYIEEAFVSWELVDKDLYDQYGNLYTYVTDKHYILDEITNSYIEIENPAANQPTLVRRYSLGYKYDRPIIIGTRNEYILADEFELVNHKYNIIRTSIVEFNGEYKHITELDEYQLSLLEDDVPMYYEVIEVQKSADANDITFEYMFETDADGNPKRTTNIKLSLVDVEVQIDNDYYYVEDVNGSYIFDGTNYIWDLDTPSSFRYSKKKAEDDIDRYSFSAGIYTANPNGTYTYICNDCMYYIAEKVADLTNKPITSITDLDYKFWESARYAMREYIIANYCPARNPADYQIPLYTGESSTYYRMLNGLPATTDKNVPKLDRMLIDPFYEGTNTNPYVWELTDREIEIIEENGTLDKLKADYPKAEYLYYLGKNRIDVVKARDAQPFDILRIGDNENQRHIDLFYLTYDKVKRYILGRYYQPELFQEFNHYVSYLGFIILANTVINCVTRSSDILIYDGYMDDKTVNNILDSFGFEGKFAKLPTIYRKMVAKNIMMLLKYRGTDKVYDIIYNICGVTNYDVFNFEITNLKDQDLLTVIKKSVLGKGENSTLTIEELIEGDDLWQLGVDTIAALDFFKSGTKYIELENIFDLSELALNNSFLLNYLMDLSKNRHIPVDVPNVGIFELFDLIAALFAIQSIKFGYTGTIPTTPAAAASIYKFNIDQALGGDQTVRSILETYGTRLSGTSLKNINHLLEMLKTTSSVVIPAQTSETVRSLADGYFDTIREDSPNTNLNENSFYKEILRLRDTASNIDEYNCYTEILDCILTSSVTADNFKLNNPVWEPIFAGTYVGNPESFNKANYTASKWAYGEDLSVIYPDIINTSLYEDNVVTENTLDDNGKVILFAYNMAPGMVDDLLDPTKENYYMLLEPTATANTYSVTIYKKCYTALTYTMYVREQCPDLYNHIYAITIDDTYVIDAYDTVFSVSAAFIRVTKENGVTVIDFGDESNYHLVDNDSDGDIDLIALRDARTITYQEYYQILEHNADTIYKSIIAKIESLINSNQLRKNLVLSHESVENVVSYIELLVNMFKAYNADIRKNNIIYEISNKTNNSLRLFDVFSMDVNTHKKDEIGIYDDLEITIHGGNE